MSFFDNFRKQSDEAVENIKLDENHNDDSERVIGKIIKLSDDGYGFIISKEIPFTRIFFHWTSLIQETKKFTELEVGDEVEFKAIEVPDKGMRAIRIKCVVEEKL